MPPLQKVTIDLPLAVGLDTKTNPKIARGMLQLENAIVEETGAIRKRKAFRAYSKTVQRLSTPDRKGVIDKGAGLYDFNGKPVIYVHTESRSATTGTYGAESGWRFMTLDASRGRWENAGEMSRLSVEMKYGIAYQDVDTSSGDAVANGMIAVNEKYMALMWYDQRITDLSFVVRTIDGLEVASTETSGVAINLREGRPHYIFPMADGSFMFVYSDNVDIFMVRWSEEDGFGTPVDTTKDTGTTESVFCAYAREHGGSGWSSSDAVVMAWADSSGGPDDMDLYWFDTDVTLQRTFTISAATDGTIKGLYIPPKAPSGISGERYIWVVYNFAASPNTMRLQSIQSNGSAAIAEVTRALSDEIDFSHMSFIDSEYDGGSDEPEVGTSPASIVMVNSRSAFSVEPRYEFVRVNNTGTMTAITPPYKAREDMAGFLPPILLDNDLIFPLFFFGDDGNPAETQLTVFLTSHRSLYAESTPMWRIVTGCLFPKKSAIQTWRIDRSGGNVSYLKNGRAAFPIRRMDELVRHGLNADSNVSLYVCILDSKPLPFSSVGVSGGLLMAGPMLGWFDSKYQEHGHLLAPYKTGAAGTQSNETNGALGTGDYTGRNGALWIDRLGNQHRSTASDTYSFTISGANDTWRENAIAHAISHPNRLEETQVIGYRSKKGPMAINHLASRRNDPDIVGRAYYDRDMGDVTFIYFIADDATISKNEKSMADTDEIEPDPVPATKLVFGRRDRVFAVPMEDPTHLWVSKPLVQKIAPEFSANLVFVFEEGGPINAGIVQDDNIVLFQERGIYVFAGEGPSATGLGSFTPARKLSTDVSAISQNGIVNTRLGTIFKSTKGFFLLDRSLTVSPEIGLPVARYNDRTVLASFVMKDRDSVRFVMSGNLALDFDLTHKLWSSFRLPTEPAHGATIGQTFHYLDKSGTLFAEDSDYWKDDTVPFSFLAETAWLKPTPNPEQRIWRLGLLGDVGDRHFTLKASLYYDFNDTKPVQVIEKSTKDAELEEGGPLFLELVPRISRCKALKLRLEDDGNAQNMSLSVLTADVGIARQLGRQRMSRKG